MCVESVSYTHLYALFNKIAIFNYHVDKNKCVSCGKCARICKMNVDITKNTGCLLYTSLLFERLFCGLDDSTLMVDKSVETCTALSLFTGIATPS